MYAKKLQNNYNKIENVLICTSM